MSSVQKTINFPIRKTRSQSKRLGVKSGKNKENVEDTPRSLRSQKGKNTCLDLEEQQLCTITKGPTKLNLQTPPASESPRKVFGSPQIKHQLDKDSRSVSLFSPPKKSKTETKDELKVRKQLFKQDSSEASRSLSPSDENADTKCKTSPYAGKARLQLFKQDLSCYQQAKQVLSVSPSTRLVGREKEIVEISSFLDTHLDSREPGSLYISGAPGTGKTACLTNILEAKKISAKFHSVFINCMSLKQPSAIYSKIANELQNISTVSKAQDNLKAIEKFFIKTNDMIVLVLDEIDQLTSKNQDVLYTVFEWPRLPKSSLILIGIANALDLTDRVLPRLDAVGSQLKLLHFAPYTREQITSILEDRLSQVKTNGLPVIKPVAIQLCARKIAACTGDIRKALDVCRCAVELVEKEAKQQLILQATSDDRCNPGSPKKASPFRPVELLQINAILNKVFGSRVLFAGSVTREKVPVVMPLQQKFFLCTFLLAMKVIKAREITVGKLHDIYCKVSKKHQIADVSRSEFLSICTMVESQGLITMKKSKEARLSKVSLKIDEAEMEYVLQDKTLLASVLADTSVVTK